MPAMHRISVTEAERDFSNLVNRVYSEGISVELERGDKVVACLTPAGPRSPLKVQDLNAFLASLPKLDDDSEAFSQDIRAIRRDFPTEANPWD
jgi:antitoxin (DNA-binding transcriptional repressor) of toxin-antitoxin stability system